MYREEHDEDQQRRDDAYWAWYKRQKKERDLVAGTVCFAAGAEHEARVLAGRENKRITELERMVQEVGRENLKMVLLATKCAGALQRDLGPMKPDMLESLLIQVYEWATRNRG